MGEISGLTVTSFCAEVEGGTYLELGGEYKQEHIEVAVIVIRVNSNIILIFIICLQV